MMDWGQVLDFVGPRRVWNQGPSILLLGAPAAALCRAHASSARGCPPFGSWGFALDVKGGGYEREAWTVNKTTTLLPEGSEKNMA